MTYSKEKIKSLFFCLLLIETAFLHILFYGPASPLHPEPPIGSHSFFTYADAANPNTRINIQTIGEKDTLVLPSTFTPESVPIYTTLSRISLIRVTGSSGKTISMKNGVPINLKEICTDDDYTIKINAFHRFKTNTYSFRIIFSENVPAMYIVSDDPVYYGRHWIEDSPDKQNKATGTVSMQKSNGEYIYNGRLKQIKGRGNSTWTMRKKPYQIKLEDGADLLCTGNKDNKAKTWILLANYVDKTLLHNTIATTLGTQIAPEMVMEGSHIDLYYDGIYRGNYVLSEKVEPNEGRVEITDLDKENESVNGNVDPETLPAVSGKTSNGATYTYPYSYKSSGDISGGYLLEMEFKTRALEETSYFVTSRGQYIVLKSPEFASREQIEYIATIYQDFEDAVYNNGINPYTGKHYSEYVDAESIAKYYLIHEFSKARDCFRSSAYFYKKAGEDKLYMGPLWDYDLAFGNGGDNYKTYDSPIGSIAVTTDICSKLLKIDSFYTLAREIYAEKLYPAIRSFLSGEASLSDSLMDFTEFREYIKSSAKCNSELWHPESDWNEEMDFLYDYMTKRAEYLKELFITYPSIATLPSNHFLDVLPSSPYHDDIVNSNLYGVMEDVGYNIFAPEAYVKRAHTIKVLHNLKGWEAPAYKDYFIDVTVNDWFSYALTWAYEKGLVTRFSHGKFKPESNVTKEDMAGMFYRLAGSPQTDQSVLLQYDDFNNVLISSRDALSWAINEGFMDIDGKLINPHSFATRAELAKTAFRFYKMLHPDLF